MDCPHKSVANKDKNEENEDKNIDQELYEKAFTAFNKTNQAPPMCCDNNVAKFRVVLDEKKDNYGRPFFVCSKHTDRCEYFEWGDKAIVQRPRCYHNETSKKRRVRKPGPNKGRLFFSCPRQRDDVAQCAFFQWEDEIPIPKTPPKEDKKDDLDDILSRFTFPKIPSSQYRIPKRKKAPPQEEKNDDDDIIPDSQPRISKWMTPQRKKQKILSSDSEEEEQEKQEKEEKEKEENPFDSPFIFYTRHHNGFY